MRKFSIFLISTSKYFCVESEWCITGNILNDWAQDIDIVVFRFYWGATFYGLKKIGLLFIVRNRQFRFRIWTLSDWMFKTIWLKWNFKYKRLIFFAEKRTHGYKLYNTVSKKMHTATFWKLSISLLMMFEIFIWMLHFGRKCSQQI